MSSGPLLGALVESRGKVFLQVGPPPDVFGVLRGAQSVDDVLCLAEVDVVQSVAYLVLHLLRGGGKRIGREGRMDWKGRRGMDWGGRKDGLEKGRGWWIKRKGVEGSGLKRWW